MKKITLVLGVLLFTLTLQAQTTASTNVKIIVADFITAEDGNQSSHGNTPGAGAEVVFNYPDAASYKKDQEKIIPNHLKVASTKTFQVTAKAMGADFTSGVNVIPVNVLDITPSAPGNGTAKTISVNTTEQQVLTGVRPGLYQIDVKYTIPAVKATKDILGKPQGTYQQVIVYKFSHI